MLIRRLGLVFAIVVAFSAEAWAQEVRLSDEAGGSLRTTVRAHPEGAYMGVIPGTGNRPPRIGRRRRGRALVVTWPGFQMTDSGSRLFLQLTTPVSVQEQRGVRSITYTILNARVSVRNNRRPLVTTHFNTPVLRARLQQRRRNVLLVIELRDDAPAAVTQGPGADGFHFLFIDFPAGTYVAPADAARLRDDDATPPRVRVRVDDGTRPTDEGMVDDERIPAMGPR